MDERRVEVRELQIRLRDACADVVADLLDVRMAHGAVRRFERLAATVHTLVFRIVLRLFDPTAGSGRQAGVEAFLHVVVQKIVFRRNIFHFRQIKGLLRLPDIDEIAEMAQVMGEADVLQFLRRAGAPHDDGHEGIFPRDDVERALGVERVQRRIHLV